MLVQSYDIKTNLVIMATYFPIIGLTVTYLMATKYSGKIKWTGLLLGPLLIFILHCLVWGFWASKVIYRSVTNPFYISALLLFLYLVGHYTYLVKRLVIYFIKSKKNSNSQSQP